MRRCSRGSAIVEFALALPIVVALVIPAVQILRAALQDVRLEVLAFRVARRVAESSPLPSDPAAVASDLIAAIWPGASCTAGVRSLVDLPSPPPRRARHVEIVEVDLSAEGPTLLAGFTMPLRAHAREFRWGAS